MKIALGRVMSKTSIVIVSALVACGTMLIGVCMCASVFLARSSDEKMYHAIRYHEVAMVRQLCEGKDINTVRCAEGSGPSDIVWTTPLHMATREGDQEIVTLLIDKGIRPNRLNSSGETALWDFAGSDVAPSHATVLDRLIAHGIDVNFQRESDGETCLHLAASCANAPAVRLLLKAGANASLKDNSGRTPLDEARASVLRDYRDAVIELLKTHQVQKANEEKLK